MAAHVLNKDQMSLFLPDWKPDSYMGEGRGGPLPEPVLWASDPSKWAVPPKIPARRREGSVQGKMF